MKDGKLSDILRDTDGKLSFSRLSGAIVLLWALSISTYLTIQNKQFVDFPYNVALIIIGLYGANKISGVIGNVLQNKFGR